MSDKRWKLIIRLFRFMAHKHVFTDWLLRTILVNLHFIITCWLIHVWKNPITGSFYIVVTFTKCSFCLLCCESHRFNHHYSFRVWHKLLLLSLLFNFEGNLNRWIFNIFKEPHCGTVCILVSGIINSVLCLYFRNSHLQKSL